MEKVLKSWIWSVVQYGLIVAGIVTAIVALFSQPALAIIVFCLIATGVIMMLAQKSLEG